MILEDLGEIEPNLKLDQSRILGKSIKLQVIDFDTKIFHLNLQIVHSSKYLFIEDPDFGKEVVNDANT